MNYLKDYVVEFCRCDFEVAHLIRTEKLLEKIDCKLPEAEILAEEPINEPILGDIYLEKKTN